MSKLYSWSKSCLHNWLIDIEDGIDGIKYFTREKIINFIKPTQYEWATMSPFGVGDGMSISIRYDFKGSQDLELRFGKNGTDWCCDYYRDKRKVKRGYCSDYFLNDEIKNEFYSLAQEINPDYFVIKVESQYKKQKKVVDFIKQMQKLFPKKDIKIHLYGGLRTFN